jgi:O-antigen/teichoic acid export membrane protein
MRATPSQCPRLIELDSALYLRNLIANYVGTAWVALLGFAFVPIYVSYLGLEAYGVIGTFVILQTAVGLIDSAFSAIIIRELGRYRSSGDAGQDVATLCRTLLLVLLTIAFVLAPLLVAFSPLVAAACAERGSLPANQLVGAVAALGIALTLRLVEGYYRSMLIGMERQVVLNAISCTIATVRSVGAVCVLSLVSGTLWAFSVWQLTVALVAVVAFSTSCRGQLPHAVLTRAETARVLRAHWRFGGGMLTLVSLTALITIADRSVLVGVLTLEQFGAYSMALSMSSVFGLISVPTGQALHARVVALEALGDRPATVRAIRSTTQLLAVLVGPVGATFGLMPDRVTLAWTGRPELVEQVAAIAGVVCASASISVFTVIPYRCRLALGSTRFWIVVNSMAAIACVSGYLVAGSVYGAVGTASVALGVNAVLVILVSPISLRHLLGTQSWRWLLHDVAIPISGAVIAVVVVRWTSAVLTESRVVSAATVFTSLCVAASVSALTASRVRESAALRARAICRSLVRLTGVR